MTTLTNLLAIYRAVHRIPDGTPLPPSAQAQIEIMASGIDAARAGQAGFGWNYPSAVQWIYESAKATTQVAVLSYGFITGLSLGADGLDYLVSASGPNPNSLNSAYYAAFNLENRFINFAVNLAKHGEGRQAFLATYGETSIHQTFRDAYLRLFGVEKPLSEIVDILSDEVPDGRGGLISRGDYFLQFGQDGANGVGTRAAMVGWLLAEAVKGGAGPYVQATRAFLDDLALDGRTSATPSFLSLYGPGGDYAPGGGSEPGWRGETARFAPTWDVDVAKPDAASPVRALATEGNDLIKPLEGLEGGLEAGRRIATGAGNDVVLVDNGPMRGRIDTGSGNDQLFVQELDGRIATGSGWDSIGVGAFAPLRLEAGEPVQIPQIDDFEKGRDVLLFPSAVGAAVKLSLGIPPTASLGEALAAYAGWLPARLNGVFEWKGDTYIFHQNDVVGLDAGDGLIRLVGVTGLAIGDAEGSGDIVFWA